MIKLFRNIRKKLIEQSKVRSYFLYAIGEIILVVIGILIALSINNWNEKRNNSIKESRYIASLHNELKIQIESIDSQLKKEESYTASAKRVIEALDVILDNESKFKEGFFSDLTNLVARKTFKIIDATYTDLISTGELNLISNDNIKNEIVVYYQELKRRESIIQNNNTHIIDNTFIPEVQKLGFYYRTSDSIEWLKDNPSRKYIDNFNAQQAEYSASLILEPKNKLLLLNLLKQRLSVGLYHLELMKETRLNTQLLSEKLKNLDD